MGVGMFCLPASPSSFFVSPGIVLTPFPVPRSLSDEDSGLMSIGLGRQFDGLFCQGNSSARIHFQGLRAPQPGFLPSWELVFQTQFCYIPQAGLEFKIPWPCLPRCWDYRFALTRLVLNSMSLKNKRWNGTAGGEVVHGCKWAFPNKFRCDHLFPAWCSVVRLAHIWRPLISPLAFPPPSGLFSLLHVSSMCSQQGSVSLSTSVSSDQFAAYSCNFIFYIFGGSFGESCCFVLFCF